MTKMNDHARPSIVRIGTYSDAQHAMMRSGFAFHSLDDVLGNTHLRAGTRGILTRNLPLSSETVDAFPALEIIATASVGFDALPVEYARQRGIVVTHTPGVLDAAVAELAIGMLFALLREIPSMDRHVRDARWSAQKPYPLTTSLAGKTVGIVGFGRIGRAIAKRLVPFDVNVIPYERTASLLDLATRADVLFICCPGGAATHHLIDAALG